MRSGFFYTKLCIGNNLKPTIKLSKSLRFQLSACPRRSYSAPAYFNSVGKQPLSYINLGQQLHKTVNKYGNRPAIISCHENVSLTFEEAKNQAEILAVQLKALGLKDGQHLGIWAPNTIQWYISFLAATLAGLPVICINPALKSTDLKFALLKARVAALVTMDECGLQNFQQILNELLPNTNDKDCIIRDQNFPHLERILMKSSKPTTNFLNYDEILAAPFHSHDVAYLNFKVKDFSAELPCSIQFTSGTTGQPKAAVLTHFNCINQARYFGRHLDLHESHKIVCMTVPLFHAFGLSVLIAALYYGSTVVLPSPTFNAQKALETVEKENCNMILGTPTMYVDMLEQQTKLHKSTSSLEMGVMGGSTCSPHILYKAKSIFGLKHMRVGYGLSEATAAIFTHDGSEPMEKEVHTVGKLFEHGEAKVINEKGETVAFGQAGELCVRGFFNMRGYLDDEQKMSETFCENRWLKTGDQFVLEPTGIGRVVGRKKDMIIRGGENIFPKEIEDFLNTHELILESQVIGVPDERMGEEICAYLRLRPGTEDLSIEDVKKFCVNRIAHFKIPKYVRIIEEFPKTNSGKIQKFKLREMFKKS